MRHFLNQNDINLYKSSIQECKQKLRKQNYNLIESYGIKNANYNNLKTKNQGNDDA